jgi:hypothetical protein
MSEKHLARGKEPNVSIGMSALMQKNSYSLASRKASGHGRKGLPGERGKSEGVKR